jgi:hypothetical protein
LFLYIVDTHFAGKESNSKEEADNENWNEHEGPGNRLQATKTERLEYTGAEHAYHEPP